MALICSGIHPNPGPNYNSDYHDLAICHVNIRSLKTRDCLGFLSKFIHLKKELANKFSVITVSETWLTDLEYSSQFSIKNYQKPFRRDCEQCNGTLGYGGVLAWVHNTVACKRREDLELPNIEAMWLEIRSKNNKFMLCVTYRQPAKNDFWDVLQTNINLVNEIPGAKIILTGDLNANPTTPEGLKLHNFANENDLKIHITEPTCYTPTSQTTLDQFLSNIPQMFKSVWVSDVPVSSNDHCTIGANLLFRKRKARPYHRIMWDFKNANFERYRHEIASCNWNNCFANENIDQATEMFTDKLLSIAKIAIPFKDVLVWPYDKPWFNANLRRLCKNKNRLHKKAKQCNSPETWAMFRHSRNEYTPQITETKANYENSNYAQLIAESKSTKTWWSII